jgi:DtxR family transcriptional regulator, Mn-dependent transcriptional regulator
MGYIQGMRKFKMTRMGWSKRSWGGRGGRPLKVLGEDLLKAVAHAGRLTGSWRAEEVLPEADAERLGSAVSDLAVDGRIEAAGGGWRLTEAGRLRAVELLRAHRLLETYLAREGGRPAGALHAEADAAEHHLSTERINELADALNRPRFDPHGDPIPERAHELHQPRQMDLTQVSAGSRVRIAHIEDEPEEDFSKLVALGLAVELPLLVKVRERGRTVVELAGEELELPAALAAHVEVAPWPEGESIPEDLRRLSALRPGEAGEVEFISPACLGPERRRLLDFGMVPGSEVRCEFRSPFGSPAAYAVRGSTIGLRRSQANNIFIRRKA